MLRLPGVFAVLCFDAHVPPRSRHTRLPPPRVGRRWRRATLSLLATMLREEEEEEEEGLFGGGAGGAGGGKFIQS